MKRAEQVAGLMLLAIGLGGLAIALPRAYNDAYAMKDVCDDRRWIVQLLGILSYGMPLGFTAVCGFLLAFGDFLGLNEPREVIDAYRKKCVQCGREIPIGSTECQYCGAKQKKM